MAGAEVFTALQTEVDAIWPFISEGMKRSCRHSNFTPGHVWQECRSGRAFLIVAYQDGSILGACVVQFQDNGRTLRGLALAGRKLKLWFDVLHVELRKIMDHGGAEVFIDAGRPGLKAFYKTLPTARQIGVVYEVR